MPDGFEWDSNKARSNHARHGVRFEDACKVFGDPFAIDMEDRGSSFDESRFITIGMVDGRLIFVAYTMREAFIRIISARAAEPQERRLYHEDDEQG